MSDGSKSGGFVSPGGNSGFRELPKVRSTLDAAVDLIAEGVRNLPWTGRESLDGGRTIENHGPRGTLNAVRVEIHTALGPVYAAIERAEGSGGFVSPRAETDISASIGDFIMRDEGARVALKFRIQALIERILRHRYSSLECAKAIVEVVDVAIKARGDGRGYETPRANSAIPPLSSVARPLSEWHEDDGPVLWWVFPVRKPPYAGTPLDLGQTVYIDVSDAAGKKPRLFTDVGGWPGYHTHWTPIPMALDPTSMETEESRDVSALAEWNAEAERELRAGRGAPPLPVRLLKLDPTKASVSGQDASEGLVSPGAETAQPPVGIQTDAPGMAPSELLDMLNRVFAAASGAMAEAERFLPYVDDERAVLQPYAALARIRDVLRGAGVGGAVIGTPSQWEEAARKLTDAVSRALDVLRPYCGSVVAVSPSSLGPINAARKASRILSGVEEVPKLASDEAGYTCASGAFRAQMNTPEPDAVDPHIPPYGSGGPQPGDRPITVADLDRIKEGMGDLAGKIAELSLVPPGDDAPKSDYAGRYVRPGTLTPATDPTNRKVELYADVVRFMFEEVDRFEGVEPGNWDVAPSALAALRNIRAILEPVVDLSAPRYGAASEAPEPLASTKLPSLEGLARPYQDQPGAVDRRLLPDSMLSENEFIARHGRNRALVVPVGDVSAVRSALDAMDRATAAWRMHEKGGTTPCSARVVEGWAVFGQKVRDAFFSTIALKN